MELVFRRDQILLTVLLGFILTGLDPRSCAPPIRVIGPRHARSDIRDYRPGCVLSHCGRSDLRSQDMSFGHSLCLEANAGEDGARPPVARARC
jgi:hypothetical protein